MKLHLSLIALAIAQKNGHAAIVQMLRAASAKE